MSRRGSEIVASDALSLRLVKDGRGGGRERESLERESLERESLDTEREESLERERISRERERERARERVSASQPHGEKGAVQLSAFPSAVALKCLFSPVHSFIKRVFNNSIRLSVSLTV